MRCAGYVWLMKPIVEEERLVFMSGHKILHFTDKIIRHVLIHPTGSFAAFHIADARDTVYN